MGEKFPNASEVDSENIENKGPEFPEDPDQYTEEELQEDPQKRFRVNPKDFPLFSNQFRNIRKGQVITGEYLPLDEQLGRFVALTADTIAVLAGEDKDNFAFGEKEAPAADVAIYLDKSARPINWLVNTFWDSFTEKERPISKFLAIDRKDWFWRTGVEVNYRGYFVDESGTEREATFSDFDINKVPESMIAGIRSLFIPGGIDDDSYSEENISKIMNTPTILDGKNVTIIDEVESTGTTMKIAVELIKKAIPECASISTHIFWDESGHNSQETHSVPVWYDERTSEGRGVYDIHEEYYQENDKKFDTPKTKAQKMGAFVLGVPMDLRKEKSQRSQELANEIQTMKREWDEGHILLDFGVLKHYDMDAAEKNYENKGVIFPSRNSSEWSSNKSYAKIRQILSERQPDPQLI